MLRRSIALLLAASSMPAAPALAQSQTDRESIANAADRAATEAERAAAEAERAMLAARQAAQAARAAANAAHAIAEGRPVPAIQAQVAPAPGLAADENLPVTRPAMAITQSPDAAAEHETFTSAVASSVANGPNESALKSGSGLDLQLVASSKDKVASLAWTVDVSGQPSPGHLTAQQLTLTASGKLDDSGDAQLWGLDGFPNGNEVKLAFTRYDSRVNLSGVEKGSVAEARRRCLDEPGATTEGCNPYDYATGVSSFVAKYYPAGLRPLLNEVLPGPVIFYGLAASGNQASFKFLDRSSFSVKKESHFSFGGGLFGGLIFNTGQTALIGSFDYKRIFDESDPITLCQPIAATTLTQCITSADGAPTKSHQSVLGLEFRHAFPAPVGSFASLAIAPKFSWDLTNQAYSIVLPVYFAGDGAGKLRGGVRGAYVNTKAKDGTREGDFTLGLFVGVPFSVFHD